MLIMFRVRNYTSFKEEVILDMRAVSYKEQKSHVMEAGNNKVVKSLAVYGKNASGKSNLISAMYCYKSFIFNQLFLDSEKAEENRHKQKMPNLKRTPFLLNDNQNDETEFEMIFYYEGKTYQYGFSVEKEIIKTEWLLVDDDEVFDRGKTLEVGNKYKKELANLPIKREDRLYLAVLDYLAEGNIKNIVEGFKSYLGQHFNVYFELIVEMSIKGIMAGLSITRRLIEDEEYRKTIEKFVKTADVGIKGIVVRKVETGTSENNDDQYEIKTIHNIYDGNGKDIGTKEFDLEMESSGTIRYISFIQNILNMLDKGGVFIVDELTARLHPVLTKFIVDLYQNEENNKAQLIFTTHDISLMNRNQFRRDEIAFVDKNLKGESTLYTLADIRARSDASFSKDYLFGKYGAIPVIKEELEGDD